MIARDPLGQSPLETYRMDHRVDLIAAGSTLAVVRLDDHRPMYLEYEGELTPGAGGEARGHVRRVATGEATDASDGVRGLLWQHQPTPHRVTVGSDGIVTRLS